MGDIRATPWRGRCGLQGVKALQPVLQNASRQSDEHVCILSAGVDGFLDYGTPADGELGHLYGRTIRQAQNEALVSLCHANDIILVHHVSKLCSTGF